MAEAFTGSETLRKWLIAQGFKTYVDVLKSDNVCNWYALRYSDMPVLDSKPLFIKVRPFYMVYNEKTTEHARVKVQGEIGGVPFDVELYSLSHEKLMATLPKINAALIGALDAVKEDSAVSIPGSN